MNLFDVYPIYPVTIEKGEDCTVTDTSGTEYLDFYGGHAVVSIGHSHPHYIKRITEQLNNIGFYSNSVEIPQQRETIQLLGELSGYNDYSFFFCNSGAEAVENALKLASFHTKRSKALSFTNSFHGRTSLAIAVTDDAKISAPINATSVVEFAEYGNLESVALKLKTNEYACVILEGIQGMGGIIIPDNEFIDSLASLCKASGTLLIVDEIQSGFGRTGKFFAHQYTSVRPDLITVAKGMGNGFPIGGVLISPAIEASYGLLGTTFGGNHLACRALQAVLEVIQKEHLIENAHEMGHYLLSELASIEGISVRGRGLMIAVDLPVPAAGIRRKLLDEFHIFTGSAKNPNTIRLLPPLTVTKVHCDQLIKALKSALK